MKMSISPPRPRGRPREFDRDAALDKALEVFWKRGYEGASIADLTQAMGITAPSLYAAFQSKAALYRESLARYGEKEGAFAARALEEEPNLQRAMGRLLRDTARQFARSGRPRGCMVSTAVLTCAEENQEVARHTAGLRRDALGRFRARFERAVAEGELPAGTDAEALARFFGAVIQGMSVQAQDGASEAQLLTIAETALKLLERSTP